MKPVSLLRLFCVCCLMLFMGGCVHSDVGVTFEHQHHGMIWQRIRLSDQLSTVSQLDTQKWLTRLEQRAQQLQGTFQRVTPQEVVVSIPFHDGQDLAKRFNQFFNSESQDSRKLPGAETLDLVQLRPQLAVEQYNWFFFERDHLYLKLDLRSLGGVNEDGSLLLSPGSLLSLGFDLQTPWGARAIANTENLLPAESQGQQPLVWQLQPGKINQIEAVFWVPSYLGLGTLGILLLVGLGYVAKYRRLPLVP